MSKRRPRTVYVCAPHRAGTLMGVNENIAFAEECGEALRGLGWTPVVIQTIVHKVFGYDTKDIDEEVTRFVLGILATCDAMCICGEHISAGMHADIAFCREEGIPTFFLLRRRDI